MKKKVDNEQVEKFIAMMAEKIRDEMDYDFRVAQGQMYIAENDLVDSLNENQYNLYKDYAQKREAFFAIARELYERKY